MRTPSNIFVVNLAICDFMMMLKTPIFIYNSFNRGFALGVAGCRIFAVVGSFSGDLIIKSIAVQINFLECEKRFVTINQL